MSGNGHIEETLRKMKLNPGHKEIITFDQRVLQVDRFVPRNGDPRGFAVVGNRIYTRSVTDPGVYASVDELFKP